jgi:primosomal protein N' (replication factor Y)
MTLNLPDYRSRERTFQLLTQVAGRAGRGKRPGRVVIQTYQPENPVIRLAARQDYRAFFEEEFSRRRISLYPPFTIMARILFEAPEDETAERTLRAVEKEVREALASRPEWKKKVLMMEPGEPGIRLLRGLSRRQILFKLLTGNETEMLCRFLTERAEAPRPGVTGCFEYNPTSMI